MTDVLTKIRESQHKSNEQRKVADDKVRAIAQKAYTDKQTAGKDIKAGPVSQTEANKALPEKTAKEFKVVNWPKTGRSTRFVHGTFGEINLRTLTIKGAEQLIKIGFENLAKVKS